MKENVRVLEGSLRKGKVEVTLGSGDSMEKTDEFMGDGIFMKEGDLFNGVEDNGGFEDGVIK